MKPAPSPSESGCLFLPLTSADSGFQRLRRRETRRIRGLAEMGLQRGEGEASLSGGGRDALVLTCTAQRYISSEDMDLK